MDDLEREVDRVLLDWLPVRLKDSIRNILKCGVPKRMLLAHIRQRTGGPLSLNGGATYLACEVYINGLEIEELGEVKPCEYDLFRRQFKWN